MITITKVVTRNFFIDFVARIQNMLGMNLTGYEKMINKALWARGYYCGSDGHVSQEQVKRYILEQQGKDVFEYDIFNCPKKLKGQLKIGDFS